jgi:hypothetical protein
MVRGWMFVEDAQNEVDDNDRGGDQKGLGTLVHFLETTQ